MKRIIILHTINHFKRYNEIEKDFFKNLSVKILAFTIEIRLFLKKNGIDYIIPEDYINDIEMINLDEKAIYFAKNWDKDLFIFKGISFGLAWQRQYFLYFSLVLRRLHIFLRLIEIEKTKEIVTIFDQNNHIRFVNKILDYACTIKDITLKFIPIEKSKSLVIFEMNPYEKRNIISLLFMGVGASYPFKISMRLILKAFWNYRRLKSSLFQRNKNHILIVGQPRFNQSLADGIFKKHKLTFLEDLPDILRKRDISHIFTSRKGGHRMFYEFTDSRKLNKLLERYYNETKIKWKNNIKKTNFKENLFIDDIPLWPIFKEAMNNILNIHLKNFIKITLLAYVTLIKDRYDFIIFDTDARPFTRCLSILASRMKIPSMVIQHGIFGNHIGVIPTYCDIHATWGKITRDFLKKYGMNSNKIKITGSPRFDKYIYINQRPSLKEKIKRDVYKKFNIDKNKKLYVLTSTFNHCYKYTSLDFSNKDYEKMLNMSFIATQNLPNSHLILKLHPGDYHIDIPIKMSENLGVKNISITKDYDIINLLVACDCLITGYSTTILEAMLLEKPIIIISFRESMEPMPLKEYNIVLHVSNYKDLFDVMKEIIKKPIPLIEYRKYLKDSLYKLDGLSTKRILNLINEFI